MAHYGSIAGADAYHSARGNADWTGNDSAKTIALQVASDWIDNTYRGDFPGYKVGGRAQEREWPRYDAYVNNGTFDEYIPSDEVPIEVEQATYEAALRQVVSPGSLAPDQDRAIKRLKADTVELEYVAGSPLQTQFTAIENILAPVLSRSGAGGSLFDKVIR